MNCFPGTNYSFIRYPYSIQKSLQAFNAADELLFQYVRGDYSVSDSPLIYNDVFGVLSVLFSDLTPQTIVVSKSQVKAIVENIQQNNLEIDNISFKFLSDTDCFETGSAFIKVPKSLELFEYYLADAHKRLNDTGEVICSFMTKYFTQSLLDIASKYFDSVTQSKAYKKSRLLILSSPTQFPVQDFVKIIPYHGFPDFKQYYGVFSSEHIDYASQFLIDNLHVSDSELHVLDLASGNGVLAAGVLRSNSRAHVTLVDDSWLAVESSKFNVSDKSATFIWDDGLEMFPSEEFDLVVSNPPFHFGHETNIEVSLALFEGVSRCLKSDGRFVLVANRHLNYKTHLIKLFRSVTILNENDKFIVYQCHL